MVKGSACLSSRPLVRIVLLVSLTYLYFFRWPGDALGQVCQDDDGVCFTTCALENDNDCARPLSLVLTEPTVFGQPDMTENVPNQVVGNRVFHPGGVLVDRGTSPNRVYVFDSGNRRILGFSSLGTCAGGQGTGQPCTNDLDCPNSTCQVDSRKNADLIIGQPDAFHASCNYYGASHPTM